MLSPAAPLESTCTTVPSIIFVKCAPCEARDKKLFSIILLTPKVRWQAHRKPTPKQYFFSPSSSSSLRRFSIMASNGNSPVSRPLTPQPKISITWMLNFHRARGFDSLEKSNQPFRPLLLAESGRDREQLGEDQAAAIFWLGPEPPAGPAPQTIRNGEI